MTHSVPLTFSPSSLRITRNTPWVDGCCGPMFRTNSVESRKVVSGMSLLAAFDAQILPYPSIVLLDDAVLLAQRIALPLLRHQDTAHVGMAFELDSEHVEHLALEPVRRQVDTHGRVWLHAVGNRSLHAHAIVSCEAVSDV